MTEAELLAQPESEYMSADQQDFFRQMLKALRVEAVERHGDGVAALAQLEKAPDDADAASIEEERVMLVRQVERARKFLGKVDAALARLDDGSYGWCDVSGEPIGLKRLLVRPTTNLSYEAKTRQEEMERHHRKIAA